MPDRKAPSAHSIRSFFRVTGTSALLALAASCETTGNGYNLGPADTVAGSVGMQNLKTGIPVGSWRCIYTTNNEVGYTKILCTLTITSDGKATHVANNNMVWKPGYKIAYGKFAGLTQIGWVTESRGNRVVREGDELYIYDTPSSKPRLLSTNPPGNSLETMKTMGGAYRESIFKEAEEVGEGVTVFKIKGNDLVLQSSTDGNQWLYKKFASN